MDDDQRNHLDGLRQAHLRRLRILEQQAAVSGVSTRPEVLTEIEDLQASIVQIESQLAAAVQVPSAPATAPARQTPPEQRRTQATILAATLVGASALFATLDPEDAAEIVGHLWQRLDAVVTEYGGVVERRADESVLAVWGAQAAHEDDPERAIRAALAMQAALADFRAEQSLTLALRVGIATGLVLIGGLGTAGSPTPMGSAVNLAGQLQQATPNDGILIAHDTYRHVRGLFAVEPRNGPARSNTAEPPQVYLVTGAKPRAFHLGTRGVEGIETRMIGRDAELARIQEAFQTVIEDRELQVITIIGEAGVGKSRLLHAFRSWEELQPEQAWLFGGRALPELMTQPFALLRDLFAFRFEIQDSDAPAAARDKLERGFTQGLGVGDPDAIMKAHFIGQLLGFDFAASPRLRSIGDDPKQLHDQALHYLSQFVGALTRARPILLVLEDLHWADDASLDALASLLHSCRAMPILALGLARPALFERRPAWGEGAEGQTRLRLEPLSKRASRQLVEEILRRAPEAPATLRAQIVAAAEGNPFYVEELIKMLIDEGAIVPGPEVWRIEAARLEALHVPSTLTGVLQARLDGLQPDERGSLERAAVVGRVFWDRAVAQLGHGDTPEQVGALLDGLRRRELVYRHEVSAFAGASEYLFKHMLLREVTYERVLKRQRRAYHAQVAAWLIAESGERADEYAALIAEHYERAGDAGQAAEWHARAGRKAQTAYANAEAIAHYDRALAGLPEEGRGAVLLALGKVLELIGEWDAAEQRYQAALALAKAAEDGAAEGQCQQALGELLNSRGNDEAARVRLEAARAGAMARGARGDEATALRVLAWLAYKQGDYAQARGLSEESLVLYRALGDKGGIAYVLGNLGSLAYSQGDYGQARALYEESLALFRTLGDKQRIASTLRNLGMVAHAQGDYGQARHLYEESLALYRALGDKQCIAIGLTSLGGLAQEQGEYTQARGLSEESLALQRELGDKQGIASSLTYLGNLAYSQGDYTQARALYEESLALYRALGDKRGIAISLHNLGGLAQEQGEYGHARALYEESLALFRTLGEKTLISISLHNLGGLAQEQGEYAQARALLEESLALKRALGAKRGIADTLAILIALTVATSQIERAARLAGAVDALLRALGAVLQLLERGLYDEAVNSARAQLDAATFEALWAEGQAMTLEQAVAYALEQEDGDAEKLA